MRARRALAAFGLGAAISAAGLAALFTFPSLAHGPYTADHPTTTQLGSSGPAIYSFAPVPRSNGERRRRDRITVIAGASDERPAQSRRAVSGAQPVCVRLCDGFFFPLPTSAGDVASQTAGCNSLCPDAPTEVYYRNGAEKIEGAVSASGRPYTALPVSLRYRNTSDATCSCHRDVVAYAPLRDSTLRRGDAVMTPAGFMVFRGAEASSHRASDFTALGVAGLARQARGELQQMERASLTPTHPTLRDWLVSQMRPPVQVAARTTTLSDAGDNKIRVLSWGGARN